MPTTKETPTIRLFLAPINEPVNGDWYEIDPLDALEDIRLAVDEVREETGREELRISDAEGLPSSMIPPYGGIPAEEIAAFGELAADYGLSAARAFVKAINLIGVDIPPEEWGRSFDRAHAGVQDSRTAWAKEEIMSGCYPLLRKVAKRHGLGYVNVDAVRRDMESDSHSKFVETDAGAHLFTVPDLTL